MYKTTLQPRSRTAAPEKREEPGLFDAPSLKEEDHGTPWSSVHPPLTELADDQPACPAEPVCPEPPADSMTDEIAEISADATDDETIGGLIQEAMEACNRACEKPVTNAPAAAEKSPSKSKKPMPSLPPPGEISRLGVSKPGLAPRRIGSGRLVPTRLTWKPGDPFADAPRRARRRFRWEMMLTSACITAACGLCCVWLLRTLLA
jgi:hypothetical protein